MRREDVAASRYVLAIGARVLVEALVIQRELALDDHVVEGRHALGANDGEAPLLVGVEPREVQVRRDARWEAQKAEDDVLDARSHV